MFRRMTDSANGAARPAPEAADKLERLKTLLREMFQLDRGDLDFGLYRIMNMKAAEVSRFLERDLLPQAKESLSLSSDEARERLEREIDETAAKARAAGFAPDDSPVLGKLRERLAEMKKDAAAEADVYNHLAEFFSRYYSEGDFVSQRRYSSGGGSAYLIPYDGEEVKLHWANADQYYVKTTENYAAYAFSLGESDAARRARFEIAAADNEKDNVKEINGRQRRFVLAAGGDAVTVDGGLLTARFEHRPLTEREKARWPGNGTSQQRRVDADSCARILSSATPDWRSLLTAPAPTEANGDRTLLARHVERYTAKNSFDYFIHKDLGGFLRRELDLYLAAEVLNLDDVERGDALRLDRALARVRAIRHIGGKIVDFLAQLEDFQKHLWLKKKFVLETHWCVTLDRVPEALWPEVAANEAQCAEWKALYAVDEVDGDLANGGAAWSEPPGTGFLKRHPFLTVDTRHFDRDFADRLLASLSDAGPLDEGTDGLLVHGENFQALNLLQARFGGRIRCVYIDPPYNTGDSEILYKNGYLRSSWLALMANRLDKLERMLSPDSVLYVAIDDFEMSNLAALLDTHYPSLRRETIIVNHHPQGGKATALSHTHEYMFACLPEQSNRALTGRRDDSGDEWRPFKRSGTAESNFRRARPNSFYAILVDPASRRVVGIEPPPEGDDYPTTPSGDGSIRIYPTDERGDERVWRRSYESCLELARDDRLRCSNGNTIYQLIRQGERRTALFSNWTDRRYNAGTHGANLLGEILGKQNQFAYPKSIHTVEDAIYAVDLDSDDYVMDCFAGSGTTGHAVISLNRQDRRQRKYILADMAEYFDSVMIPRLKKAVYSADWKDGKPVSREGVSQLFKYVRLESYEDTMDSLEIALPPEDYLAANSELAEDYRLRYALGEETRGSACLLGKHFVDPFSYTLSVVRDGVRREAPVDLPETFNLLIGLTVESRRRIDGVLAISGVDGKGRHCLVLWRDLRRTDAAALDAWFAEHRARLAKTLDIVHANGDHTLGALRKPEEGWTAETIEPAFRALMFDAAN